LQEKYAPFEKLHRQWPKSQEFVANIVRQYTIMLSAALKTVHYQRHLDDIYK
jgi:hypothetical protein